MDRDRRGEASRLRQEIQKTHAKVGAHLEALLDKRVLLRGSLYRWQRRCGSARCRCNRGQLHSSWVFSRRRDGQLQKSVIAAEDLDTYKRAVEAYRGFRWHKAAVTKAHDRLRRLLNALEESLQIEEPPPRRAGE